MNDNKVKTKVRTILTMTLVRVLSSIDNYYIGFVNNFENINDFKTLSIYIYGPLW